MGPEASARELNATTLYSPPWHPTSRTHGTPPDSSSDHSALDIGAAPTGEVTGHLMRVLTDALVAPLRGLPARSDARRMVSVIPLGSIYWTHDRPRASRVACVGTIDALQLAVRSISLTPVQALNVYEVSNAGRAPADLSARFS